MSERNNVTNGSEYFDLLLSITQQQKFYTLRESFSISIQGAFLKSKIAENIKKELVHYFKNKREIKRIKDLILKKEDKSKQISKIKRTAIIGKLKRFVNKELDKETADNLHLLNKEYKSVLQLDKLHKAIDLYKKKLYSLYLPSGINKDLLNTYLTKIAVLDTTILILENNIEERNKVIDSKFKSEYIEGVCYYCSMHDLNLVKLQCGGIYHIQCLNDKLMAGLTQSRIGLVKCDHCNKKIE